MKVAIQGDKASACDMAFEHIAKSAPYEKFFCLTAEKVVNALVSSTAGLGLFALESPVGVSISETALALRVIKHQILLEICLPVEHAVLCQKDSKVEDIRSIYSHEVALRKYKNFLMEVFPNAVHTAVSDSGIAANRLSKGQFGKDGTAIAMPKAAKLFGLKILFDKLPGNDTYLTKFALVKLA
jgi:prephenate dehydratase